MIKDVDIQPEVIETPYGKRLFFDVEQNSPQWFKLRSGIITASSADRICTPAKMEYAKGSESYMNHLLAEREVGHILEWQSEAMKIGHEREQESREAFTLATGIQVKTGGFWTTEDGKVGASPDGLIERAVALPEGGTRLQRGILELKNPNAGTHEGYRRTRSLEKDYWIQLLTQLHVTGTDYTIIQSYYPEMKSVRMERDRDEDAIKVLVSYFEKFNSIMEQEWERLTT